MIWILPWFFLQETLVHKKILGYKLQQLAIEMTFVMDYIDNELNKLSLPYFDFRLVVICHM